MNLLDLANRINQEGLAFPLLLRKIAAMFVPDVGVLSVSLVSYKVADAKARGLKAALCCLAVYRSPVK